MYFTLISYMLTHSKNRIININLFIIIPLIVKIKDYRYITIRIDKKYLNYAYSNFVF